jgi:hypothetical protein
MKAAHAALIAVILDVPLAPAPAQRLKPADDTQLADWIANGTQDVKERAVGYVLTMAPEQRSLVIEEALVKELNRLNGGCPARGTSRTFLRHAR